MPKIFIVAILTSILSSCIPLQVVRYSIKIGKPKKVIKGDKNPIELPFYLENNTIIIPAKINENKGDFIFDTGAYSLVDFDFNQNLQAKKQLMFFDDTTFNPHETLTFSAFQFDSLVVDDFEVKKPWLGEILFRNLPRFKCKNISGIIGSDVLTSNWMKFDFQENKLIFADSLEQILINGNTPPIEVGITDIKGMMLLPIKVNGQWLNILIDTGAPIGLLLFKPSTDTSRFNSPGMIRTGIGPQVASKNFIKTFPTATSFYENSIVTVGDIKLKVPVRVSDVQLLSTIQHDGLIGVEFLKHFNPILSKTEKKMFLEINDSTIANLNASEIWRINNHNITLCNNKLTLKELEQSLFNTLNITKEEDLEIVRINEHYMDTLKDNFWCDEVYYHNIIGTHRDSSEIELKNGAVFML